MYCNILSLCIYWPPVQKPTMRFYYSHERGFTVHLYLTSTSLLQITRHNNSKEYTYALIQWKYSLFNWFITQHLTMRRNYVYIMTNVVDWRTVNKQYLHIVLLIDHGIGPSTVTYVDVSMYKCSIGMWTDV